MCRCPSDKHSTDDYSYNFITRFRRKVFEGVQYIDLYVRFAKIVENATGAGGITCIFKVKENKIQIVWIVKGFRNFSIQMCITNIQL